MSVFATISLRSVKAHTARLVLTVASVVLGTAFIAGSLLFTATLDKAFDSVLDTAFDGVDVVVEAPDEDATALTVAEADGLHDIPGVQAVSLSASPDSVIITGADGTAIQTGGAATQAMPWDPGNVVGQAPTFTEGGPPGPGEVAVNAGAAVRGALHPGMDVTVVTPTHNGEARISGIYESEAEAPGWVGVYVPRQQWLDWYTDGIHVPEARIAVADGTTPDGVAGAVRAAHPDLEVSLGADRAAQLSKSVSDSLSFVNYFLIAFGLIGLTVGAFLISNTFSMIVAQRMREFALLRSLGASRGQLTRSVAGEAAIVGVIGAALGVAAGFGLVQLVFLFMESSDMGMPGTGITVTPQSVIMPLIVGTLLTVAAAWAPARRAGATPPVAAMRSGDAAGATGLRIRTIAGGVLVILGAAVAVTAALAPEAWGLSTGWRAGLAGIGTLAVIGGFWLVSAALSIPVVGAIGLAVGKPFGAAGKLAATNARRTPRRTAATAFALSLGLLLVSALGMFGASMKAATQDYVDNNVRADLVLSTVGMDAGGLGLPVGIREEVKDIPGVAAYAEQKILFAGLGTPVRPPTPPTSGGHNPSTILMAFDGDIPTWFDATPVAGSLDLSRPGAGIVLQESQARALRANIGAPVVIVSRHGRTSVPLTGIMADDPAASPMVSTAALADRGISPDTISTFAGYIRVDDGADVKAVQDAVAKKLKDHLIVRVDTREESGNALAASFDVMLNILYGLLGLAVIISVLGIINTLALSITERRQEIGMLRAVGMSRRQVRTMVRIEAVATAINGALAGIIMGLGLGWAFLSTLSGEGLDRIVVPWSQVIVMLIAATLIGVLSAAWPAHRAAATPPLAAITDE